MRRSIAAAALPGLVALLAPLVLGCRTAVTHHRVDDAAAVEASAPDTDEAPASPEEGAADAGAGREIDPSTKQGAPQGLEGSGRAPVTRQDVLDIVAESRLPVDISGGIFLWHYQPLLDGVDPNTEIYWAFLRFDVDLPGDIDFHLETMFRDSKLRPFFDSNVWIQEAYLNWKPDEGRHGQVKVGKIYSRFGRFWDGTFYGNAPYFDGLKLDPDIGISYEHAFDWSESTSVEASLQYFTRDGGTNGSLQNRDTLSYAGAVQRDSVVGRFAPTFSLTDSTDLTLGVSAMSYQADFASGTEDDRIFRWNVESALAVHDVTLFAELASQNGVHAPDYPSVGANESDISWIMSGVDYQLAEKWLLGYRFSYADYNDSDVHEVFHMPRVQYQLSEAVSLWLEYVHWDQESQGPTVELDDSLNLVLYASF